jgi:hypothetical protein
MDFSETRATGHNDFLVDSLHVWTQGSGSTDKAAGYIAQADSLADIAAAPEPTLAWAPQEGLPAIPGKQIVVDFDGNGSPDGILIGEPVYGDNWWLNTSAQQFVKDDAPHEGGGYGSPWYGTLDEWSAAFGDAATVAVGYSLGSGVHGDGIISAMSYGDSTYTFAYGLGSCPVSINDTTQTFTLTSDCSTLQTINVADGWTVDGAGHTITAVEDATHPNFPGPVMLSAPGVDGNPASMDITNLTINTQFSGSNSGGQLAGIKFDRAGGSVTDTTITGITHGNGVQEGIALYVRNRAASGGFSPDEVTVTVDGTDVTRYQKSGVIFDGNVAFTMTNSNVGRSTDKDGNPIPNTAANAVQLSRGAHGSLTDNTIALNDYNPSPPPGDGSDATGVLVYDSGAVTLSKNLIVGTNGDVGIDATNDGAGGFATSVNVSCTLLQRNDDGVYDPYGIGIAQWSDAMATVNLSDTTFVCWNMNTAVDAVAGTGPADVKTGACVPNAPPTVDVTGGDHVADVSWTASTAPAYAPVSGYDVTLTGDDASTVTQHYSAGTTTAHFSGLAQNVTYTATVAATNASGSSAGTTAEVYGTDLTLTPDKATITYKKSAHLQGNFSTDEPGANLAGRQVKVEAQAAGSGTWTPVATFVTDADGNFNVLVKPKKNTTYRATYLGGAHDLSSSTTTLVSVAPKVGIKVSDSTVSLGTTVQFSGKATPNLKYQTAKLERLQGGVWVTIDTAVLNKHSRYNFFWESDVTGTKSWRVTIAASTEFAEGHSKTKKVVVS